jgi:hydrophobic/amphiphilic exporter-1 (mainly G- bacteria), HAE1 family
MVTRGGLRSRQKLFRGISFDSMTVHQEAVNRILHADPSVVQFFSGVGGSFNSGMNNGRACLHLKDRPDRPWTDSPAYNRLVARYGHVPVLDSVVRFIRPLYEHHMTIDDVIHELQPKLDKIPGIQVFLTNPPSIRIGGHHTKSMYQYTLSRPSMATGSPPPMRSKMASGTDATSLKLRSGIRAGVTRGRFESLRGRLRV